MQKGEETSSNLRNITIRFVQSNKFEYTIFGCILANSFILALYWFNQPEEIAETMRMINIIFNGIFTLEAAVKIYAMRCRYFKVKWNIYDFLIVSATYVFMFLNLGSTTTILRILRIGRVVRLVKKSRQIKIIYYTIVSSSS